MKIVSAVVGSLVLVLTLTGFSITTFGEYLQVARNRTQQAVDQAIPLSVEIDRMEVLLAKLDNQVATQKYKVARAKVALEDATQAWEHRQQECARLVQSMRSLRDSSQHAASSSTGSGTCGGSTTLQVSGALVGQFERSLRQTLEVYKAKKAACEAQAKIVENQQSAFVVLEDKFSTWLNDRMLLKQRLETLRVRHQAQQLADTSDTDLIDNADLARATELADKIERELRIAEAKQRLDSNFTPARDVAAVPNDGDLKAEVDAILNQDGV